MDVQGQLLRAIDTRAVVLIATEIPRLGFGQSEVTKELGNGLISSQVVDRWFRLSCGCTVQSAEECGAPCPRCRDLIQQQVLGLVNREAYLNVAELDWAATPCRQHYFRCAFPCCAIHGCEVHVPKAENSEHYCVEEHFDLIRQELGLARTEERYGPFAARLQAFYQSLFFDKWIDL